MRFIDADKLIQKAEKVLNKGVYKTMLVELIENAPTESVYVEDACGFYASGCNRYVCRYCIHEGTDKCDKCFALPDGRMRKFDPFVIRDLAGEIREQHKKEAVICRVSSRKTPYSAELPRKSIGIFRGKNEDNEWVIGNLMINHAGRCFIYSSERIDGKTNEKLTSVYPNSVGECTGMTDKSGNYVFEGDFLKWEGGWLDGTIEQVFWDFGDIGTNCYDDWPEYCEVIGNVIDTPCLIRKKAGVNK